MKPIYFFPVEILTLSKLDHLTNTLHIKIIKTYYKNVDSATVTYSREDYGLHNCPITLEIDKIMKIFEEIGVVTNIERSVHYRLARSTENIAIVCESVAEDPNVSFSEIRTVLLHVVAYFAFRSTSTSI